MLKRLERSGPDSIEFVEYRFSKMLKTPLRAEGTLKYTANGELEREVSKPQREITRIDASTVRIEREDAKPRTVALSRVPELRVLLNSFTAILTGNTTALERDFNVSARESGTAWTVGLVPKDDKLAQRIPELTLQGMAQELWCFTMLDARGGATVMVLGDRKKAVPAVPSQDELATLCSIP